MHIGFLVLHYKVSDVTIECLESIRKLDIGENKLHILVVDNCSNDGSGESLRSLYQEDTNIEFLILTRSTGFSNGNNIGYKYITGKYRLDFLVVANNDIIFGQKEFLMGIWDIYKRERFFVLGPDIYIPKRNMHDNPHYIEYRDEDVVERMLAQMDRRAKRRMGKSIIVDYMQSTTVYGLYKRKFFRHTKQYKQNLEFTSVNYYDATLSGACLIFSKPFLEVNEKLFWPETQFYWEEEILRHRCLLNDWLCLYDPSIKVIHNEGVATDCSCKSLVNKRVKKLRQNMDSASIYLNYIKENPLADGKLRNA